MEQLAKKVRESGVNTVVTACLPHEKMTPFFSAFNSFKGILDLGLLYPGPIPEHISPEEQLNIHHVPQEYQALLLEFLYQKPSNFYHLNRENKIHMLREALHAVSDNVQHPYCVIYEDMQWVDEATLIGFQRSLEHPPRNIVVVITSRGGSDMNPVFKYVLTSQISFVKGNTSTSTHSKEWSSNPCTRRAFDPWFVIT